MLYGLTGYQSPSTRRAWIEIPAVRVALLRSAVVALHPEGVDRNVKAYEDAYMMKSPSTRRAWIEINQAVRTSSR